MTCDHQTLMPSPVHNFLAYARIHAGEKFQLTPVGCGLAGYKPEQIAPMFRDAPPNVILPDEFKAHLPPNPNAEGAE